nr:hypothetical protein [Sphingomonas alba]
MRSGLPGWSLRRENADTDLAKHLIQDPAWIDEPGLLHVFAICHDREPRYYLRFCDEIGVDVRFGSRTIVEHALRPDIPQSTRDHFLADQVLPRILGHSGALVLHAAAVRIGNGAVLLLGKSGSGKSTLAASFAQAGHGLLGDDALIISWRGQVPLARTVYPSLRLFPDSLGALFAEETLTTSVAHYTPKLRVNVPLKDLDESGRLPVHAMFALGTASRDNEILIRPKTIANGCMTLIENSFVLDPTDPGRAPSRLEAASRLSGQVPTFDLYYPRAYSWLPDVRAAMVEALGKNT